MQAFNVDMLALFLLLRISVQF